MTDLRLKPGDPPRITVDDVVWLRSSLNLQ